MLPVLLLVTAFIVYGTLYPWQFHAAQIPGNPLLILLRSWSFEANRYFLSDTAVNVVLYLPFGAACHLWLANRGGWIKISVPIILALLLSSCLEMIQIFDARRVCSALDVTTNVFGAALGIVIAQRYRATVSLRPRTAPPLFLLACWVGMYLFPFLPDISSRHLLAKLAAFTAPPISPLAFFTTFVSWLVAARLVEASYQRTPFPLLLLLLPARLFVVGVTLSWTDCLPALLALLVWFAWPAYHRERDSTLAGLVMASILATGLAPYHLSRTPQQFSWIPFRALFSTDWENGFAIFFHKSFLYGSAVWLLLSPTVSWLRAALSVAALLAALEVVQLWLPNHVAESTDPLQALMLAWLLSRLRNETLAKRVTSGDLVGSS